MFFGKEKKLKVLIFAAFSCLITFVLVIQFLYSQYSNNKLFKNFETEYFAKTIVDDTAALLDKYFKNIETTINILATNFLNNEQNQYNRFKILFLNCLKSIKQSTSIAISFRDGTFFEALLLDGQNHFKDPENGLLPNYVKFAFRALEHIENSKNMRDKWQYLSEDLTNVTTEELLIVKNISKSSWYIAAEIGKEAIWSDPCVMPKHKDISIVLSQPIGYYNDSTAVGVMAITLSAGKINAILREAMHIKNAVAYLISQKDEIISSSSDFNNLRNNGQDIEIVQSMESGDEILIEASRSLMKVDEGRSIFSVAGKGYIASIKELNNIPFKLLIVIPQDNFIKHVNKINYEIMIVTLAIIILSILFALLLSKKFANPLTALCKTAKSISAFSNIEYITPPSSKILEISQLAEDMNILKMSNTIFEKYSPIELISKLVHNKQYPLIGGETKQITTLFTDIENFSSIAEHLPAEYLVLHLSEYLEELSDELIKNNATIDKYIGDAIMAVWGAQENDPDQIVNACHAAFCCQLKLKELEKKWHPLGKPALPTRIGIHTGQAIVGNIGSANHMNFTTIGDVVNIASRLESANKFYGTKIIVSEDIANGAKGRILFRIIDRIAVKGKTTALNIYEPLCTTDDTDSETYYRQIELSAKSKEAFELYQMREFARALERYEQIVGLFPNIKSSIDPIIKRCKRYTREEPENFDGIFYMEYK